VLKADIKELHFETNRSATSEALKDFTLWNCSEVPLSFRICTMGCSPRGGSLSLTNLETGLPLT
jgi:hypothetical protein